MLLFFSALRTLKSALGMDHRYAAVVPGGDKHDADTNWSVPPSFSAEWSPPAASSGPWGLQQLELGWLPSEVCSKLSCMDPSGLISRVGILKVGKIHEMDIGQAGVCIETWGTKRCMQGQHLCAEML